MSRRPDRVADSSEARESDVAAETRSLTAMTSGLYMATVALVMATIAIGMFQCRALDKADETTRSTNRAFVSFNRIIAVEDRDGDKAVFAIEVELINNGNTPARNTEVITQCPSRDGSFAGEPFDLKWDKAKTVNITLGPKESIFQIVCPNLSQQEWSDIVHHLAQRYVIGEIHYNDAFSPKIRRTRMARRLFIDKNGTSNRNVGAQNCADDDCLPPHQVPKVR